MFEYRKVLRGATLGMLLICTAFILYSFVIDPFGEHNIMFPLAVSAGFVALGDNKFKSNKNKATH